MPWFRYLPILIGMIIILGLMVWLVGSLSWLYANVAYFSPLLGNILLLVLIGLLLGLIGLLVYYAVLFQRPRRRPQRPRRKLPKAKTEAAAENLRAIRQQVQLIQDEVARQVLLKRSRNIADSLSGKAIQVVIFGTGSAGKTSIINAIMGRMAGEVGAPMGTTAMSATYPLQLQGLNREIWLTDTPGILEAGVAGTEREQLARRLATEADLLLFVVDNDLRQSEYEPLRTLADIGKRSLLVFNKVDLYPEDDQKQILDHLRDRVQGVIEPIDIVAIAAHPQNVQLDSGDWLQPDPEIMPLLQRMADILRAEGEDLVADNILLQSQQLGDEARQTIDLQRRRQADQVVDRFQWIGAGVIAVTPLPVVDLLATAAVNAQMVVEIGRVYGCEIDLDRGRELALSLAKTLASLGIVKGALQLLSTALQTNVATFIAGRAIQAVTAAYLTRIAGKSFIEYFRQDQDWGDGGMTEVVQRQFQLNRRDEFVKAFVQDAIARVVTPLMQQPELEAEPELEPEPEPESDGWEDWR